MQIAIIRSTLTSPVSGFILISLIILLVASLVSQSTLQNSANLGKNAELNTDGIHNSKKLVNSVGVIGILAVKVTVLLLVLEV